MCGCMHVFGCLFNLFWKHPRTIRRATCRARLRRCCQFNTVGLLKLVGKGGSTQDSMGIPTGNIMGLTIK